MFAIQSREDVPGCPGASLVGGKLFSEVLNIIAFPHDLVWIRKLLYLVEYATLIVSNL